MIGKRQEDRQQYKVVTNVVVVILSTLCPTEMSLSLSANLFVQVRQQCLLTMPLCHTLFLLLLSPSVDAPGRSTVCLFSGSTSRRIWGINQLSLLNSTGYEPGALPRSYYESIHRETIHLKICWNHSSSVSHKLPPMELRYHHASTSYWLIWNSYRKWNPSIADSLYSS